MKSRLAPNYLVAILFCLPIAIVGVHPATAASSTGMMELAQANSRHSAHRLPKAGMTQAQVKRYYGNPTAVRKSRGKVKTHWPRITAWHYGTFTVYFERKKALHTVVH